MNGRIKKRVLHTRFPETIKKIKQRLYLHVGMREEEYPFEMRRILYLSQRNSGSHPCRRY